MRFLSAFASVVTLSLAPITAHADFRIEAEGGAGISGYNDVRIPGDTGTKFSLRDDLEADPTVAGRVRLAWEPGRHHLSVLLAPLSFDASGTVDRAIVFQDQTFAAGTPLDGRYQFDTYRLSYQYRFLDRPTVRLAGGATVLLRVAEIHLEGGGRRASKSNTGVVPLLRLQGEARLLSWLGFGLEADGLASPQGRAFDVAAAALFPFAERWTGRIGYRFVEGGADNDEVYNSAWLHLPFVGLTLVL